MSPLVTNLLGVTPIVIMRGSTPHWNRGTDSRTNIIKLSNIVGSIRNSFVNSSDIYMSSYELIERYVIYICIYLLNIAPTIMSTQPTIAHI